MNLPQEASIVICGLPGSGKTTYLAALWHVVFQKTDPAAALKFDSLRDGDKTHLNQIATRWQQAKEQIHTEASSEKLVSMNLVDADGQRIRMTFPDVSGESYQEMWEKRECSPTVTQLLGAGDGVMLFVNANEVRRPIGVAEVTAQAAALGGNKPEPTVAAEWHSKDAPTAVQIVDLLQMLRCEALHSPARRLAIMLSAWDKVEGEGMPPEAFLAQELSFLDQYLRGGDGSWDFRIYGLSAQGGDYEPVLKPGKQIDPNLKAKVDEMRKVDEPASRIRIFAPTLMTDLTEPIAWLRN